jgi:single-stranded-DNA-specific exonuclease
MRGTWRVKAGGLQGVGSLPQLQALLLEQRNITAHADTFLRVQYERDTHDPFDLFGLAPAVDRIFNAIAGGERIVIYGDYDVDGVSSTALLLTALRDLGARVSPYLPHRHDDGYGLRQHVLDRLVNEMDLLITVDCGISSAVEVAALRERGIDTIILDHHTIPEVMPQALAVIHPRHPEGKYPYGGLCGAGVAWKVATALLRDPRSRHREDSDREKLLLDLAALGTFADMVPLLGENRVIAYFGLQLLQRTERPGLRALVQSAIREDSLTEHLLAFRVIPLLNAAGRMDHAQPALELLLTQDTQRAQELLALLMSLNQQRQSATRRVLKEVEANPAALERPVIVAGDPAWPSGVVGLVAGRLARALNRPAIIVGTNGVGSARSPKGVSILEVLEKGAAHLARLGGHTQAAGFTVKPGHLEKFIATMQEQALPVAKAVGFTADAVIDQSLLSWHTCDLLDRFAPFGIDNERPRFIAKKVVLAECRPVGKNQEHSKFTFRTDDGFLDGIGFGLGEEARREFKAGDALDVLGELEKNVYRGRSRLQLAVQAVAPAGRMSIVEDEIPARHAVH